METIDHDSQTPAAAETKAVAVHVKKPKKPSSEGMAMIAMIERVAMNPDVDISKMQAIVDMRLKLDDRAAEVEYNAAMARAQEGMAKIVKTAWNKHTSSFYADLGVIVDAIKPVYTKEGLSLSFGTLTPTLPNHINIYCDVAHAAGHTKRITAEIALDTVGAKGGENKTAVQGWGSTVTYARRYIQVMIFNLALAGEDKDGNAPPIKELELSTQAADWIAAISECTTLQSMQAKYNEGFKNLTELKDNFGKNQLIKAKDKRKAELTNAPKN